MSETQFVVRPARAADAEAILAAHRAAVLNTAASAYSSDILNGWAASLEPERIAEQARNLESGETVTFVAESSARVVGFGVIVPKESELRALYVHSDFGGGGAGSAIIAQLESAAAERGLEMLWLAASLNAESFYARHGYEVVRRGEHTLQRSGVTMACVYMRKQLRG